MMLFLFQLVLAVLLIEILFRIAYYVKYRKSYTMIPKVPFKKMYVKPHPYLPYVYKKRFTNDYSRSADYPLNKDKGYRFVAHTSNNLGIFNGPKGDRDVIIPKPEGLIRINCLGASTTGNYIFYNGNDYSYPMELEKILCTRFKDKKIEVNNFGIGGWTSAEILISFLLNGQDTSPDMVFLYHAYNDLEPSLIPGFQSDYSHAKLNLAERYHLYRLVSLFPFFPLASYNWAVNRFIGQNISHTLLSSVSKGTVDYSIDFQGLATYRRNMEYIINICLSRNIAIVLSTFCFYLYDGIRNSQTHKKLQQGVLKENEIVKELSLKYNIPLVDNYNLIPKEDEYFVDSVHFTPGGMSLLAKNLSVSVIKYLEGRDNDKKDYKMASGIV
jgi:lysophospholipase L1-like esterase